VRVEAVEDEEEGQPLIRGVEELHPPPEKPGGEVVFLALAAPGVGEVLAHLVYHVLVVAGYGVLAQLVLGYAQLGTVAIALLAPHPIEHPKAALEVHRGVEHGLGVREEGRVVAGPGRDLGERRLRLRDGLPARRLERLARQAVDVPERPGPHARVYGPARAEGRQRVR
jgi:hypothetical protein